MASSSNQAQYSSNQPQLCDNVELQSSSEKDDKFIERVRAAVEEEERQAKAAAAASAAKDAIATAEESRKVNQSHGQPAEVLSSGLEDKESQDRIFKNENAKSSKATVDTGKQGSEGP